MVTSPEQIKPIFRQDFGNLNAKSLFTAILTERLHLLPHADGDHEGGSDGDQLEKAKNGQEAFVHLVRQRGEDHQQHEQGDDPQTKLAEEIQVGLRQPPTPGYK
jgi:hypothetical protein